YYTHLHHTLPSFPTRRSSDLYQKFTHPGMFKERVVKSLPEHARDESEAITALARPNEADLDEFRRGIEPLASAGKLGALLAQFPASFKNDGPAREYLTSLLRAFDGYPLAVELRHRTWSDALLETLTLLNDLGA